MKSLVVVLVVSLSCLTLGQVTVRHYLVDNGNDLSKALGSSEENDSSGESEKDSFEDDLDDFLTGIHAKSFIDHHTSSHSANELFISKIVCLDKDVPPPRSLS